MVLTTAVLVSMLVSLTTTPMLGVISGTFIELMSSYLIANPPKFQNKTDGQMGHSLVGFYKSADHAADFSHKGIAVILAVFTKAVFFLTNTFHAHS